METKRLRKSASWMTETQKAFENLEDTKVLSRIVLRIVRYMKDNGLTQKELAARLNVTPQYVNKLLHGADSDLRITTALRYGRLLGLDLISIAVGTTRGVLAAKTENTPYSVCVLPLMNSDPKQGPDFVVEKQN